jgi:hypothetical protein
MGFCNETLSHYVVCNNNTQHIELWVQLVTIVNYHGPRDRSHCLMAVIMVVASIYFILIIFIVIWYYIFWYLRLSWHPVAVVQYCTVQYSTVQYCTVQYSTVQYSTVLYSTVQYSTVQYSTVHIYTHIIDTTTKWSRIHRTYITIKIHKRNIKNTPFNVIIL